jgi:hypothetical protein
MALIFWGKVGLTRRFAAVVVRLGTKKNRTKRMVLIFWGRVGLTRRFAALQSWSGWGPKKTAQSAV